MSEREEWMTLIRKALRSRRQASATPHETVGELRNKTDAIRTYSD